jgi:hypothetical protein
MREKQPDHPWRAALAGACAWRPPAARRRRACSTCEARHGSSGQLRPTNFRPARVAQPPARRRCAQPSPQQRLARRARPPGGRPPPAPPCRFPPAPSAAALQRRALGPQRPMPATHSGCRPPGCRGGGGDIAAAVRRASSRQLPSSCLGGALHHLHGVDHLLRGLWVQGGVMRAGDKLRGPWQRPRPRGAGACCHCQITGAAHLHAC